MPRKSEIFFVVVSALFIAGLALALKAHGLSATELAWLTVTALLLGTMFVVFDAAS